VLCRLISWVLVIYGTDARLNGLNCLTKDILTGVSLDRVHIDDQ
jgi:hypothetical protein